MPVRLLAAICFLAATCCHAQTLTIPNAGFEQGDARRTTQWAWWSRSGEGQAQRSDSQPHGGSWCVNIRHSDTQDWAFSSGQRFAVRPGQAFRVTAWARVETGGVTLATVALRGGQTLSWDIGSDEVSNAKTWKQLEAIAIVPENCDQIYLRFVGRGATQVWLDDVAIQPHEVKPPEPKPLVQGFAKQRVREQLDRGLVVQPVSGGQVYLSWRLLDSDPPDVAFDVYRRTGEAAPLKLTERPLNRTTDFTDRSAAVGVQQAWHVQASAAGDKPIPAAVSRPVPATPTQNDRELRPYRTLKLQSPGTIQKVGVGDLDGDGQYDFVVKTPEANIDPYEQYWQRSPDTYKLEAYRHDGTFLWRYDLGWAIERGIWYSPYVVYDLDGDGRAEVAVKTGAGDPRDADGRVQSGPEYLTILDGTTGQPIVQAAWPDRDLFGPNSYNYASRNQLGVAYLDGKTPCLLVERGTYGRMILVAYEFHDRKLRELWRWDNRRLPRTYWGQGAHWLHAADVDEDGRDEVVLGSVVIDDNGDALWTTGLGHPDHCYVGDIDPARPGLEIYYGIESRQRTANGMCLVAAKTGQILWGHQGETLHIHSTGLCADIDPATPGAECFSGERDAPEKRWLRDCRGRILPTADLGGLAPRSAYWDSDPQRELVLNRKLVKFTDLRGPGLGPKLEGSLVAVADLTGDWREELLMSLPGELRIYSTTIPATDRRVCLMQDPLYRLDVVGAAMGYYQVPMTSYDVATGKR